MVSCDVATTPFTKCTELGTKTHVSVAGDWGQSSCTEPIKPLLADKEITVVTDPPGASSMTPDFAVMTKFDGAVRPELLYATERLKCASAVITSDRPSRLTSAMTSPDAKPPIGNSAGQKLPEPSPRKTPIELSPELA